jgi:tetratricopeptide (TPR) repeat protein
MGKDKFSRTLKKQKQAKATSLEVLACFQNGLGQHQAGNLDIAEGLYKQVLAHEPLHSDALHLLGFLRHQKNASADAVKLIGQAIRLNPNVAAYHCNLGIVLFELKHYVDALASYSRALALQPAYPEVYYNTAKVQEAQGRYQDALASLESALALNPQLVDAHFNKGVALEALKRHAEALICYQNVLQLNPSHIDAHWSESLCRLKLGDFALGWQKFEWRWRNPKLALGSISPYLNSPPWLGDAPLAGKTILLHIEQGLGDTLQFCRYAPLVAARGADVVLAVQPALKTLLADLPGVRQIVSPNDEWPGFDCHCPLMSLPLAFGTRIDTIPADIPYIFSDPTKVAGWRDRLGEKKQLWVGLVGSGNPSHKNDSNRSIPLASLLDQLPVSARYFSLHQELRPADQATLDQHPELQHFGDQLNDFSDTAALLELLDLVISVDTAVAHLAGAMGKPVWLLLPFNADWRWLLDRDDSPWYPTMRLFRQQSPGNWGEVIARIKSALP